MQNGKKEMKQVIKQLKVHGVYVLTVLLTLNAPLSLARDVLIPEQAASTEKKPEATSTTEKDADKKAEQKLDYNRYDVRTRFTKGTYEKDNNAWIYTSRFAELFGMPPSGIDDKLEVIEAAAFRVEEMGHKKCGYGGMADSCMDTYRCITDIYIDESKHPLPWATDQKADWLGLYSSLRWLKTATEDGWGITYPKGVIPNTVADITGTLPTFADPETHREVNFFQNGHTSYAEDNEDAYNLVRIYGYKKQAIADLSMLSMEYGCYPRYKKKYGVTFSLDARSGIGTHIYKKYYRFVLPNAFEDQINARVKAYQDRRSAFFRSTVEKMLSQ